MHAGGDFRHTTIFKLIRNTWKVVLAIITPLVLLPLIITVNTQQARCAFVILWMACYYVFEPISASATSLLPIVLFPMLGIMGTSEVAPFYYKDIIMMFLGSLIIASAIEHSNLHRRIALRVLLALGTTIRWLMVGFIATTMFLSMWMVNTSTAALMVPIVEVVVDELEKEGSNDIENGNAIKMEVEDISNSKLKEREETHAKKYSSLRKALLLSVAYSSICGGLGTVVGTGPNLILVGLLEDIYPNSNQVTFANWMVYAVPGMLLCNVCVFIVLQAIYVGICHTSKQNTERVRAAIKRKYEELGPINFHEMAVLSITFGLVLSWMFLDPNFMRGWAPALTSHVKISNATPAIAAAILLFILPANPRKLDWRRRLLDWKTAEKKAAWGILLIFGGGFAIAEGAKRSKLSTWFSTQLKHLPPFPPMAILSILCIMTATLTEAMTNSSTTTLLLPVAYELAKVIEVHPLYIMMPLTLCASFSFMLPVGSPSCALVYDAGNMRVIDLIKPGIFLNIMCCAIQVISMNTLGYLVFDLSVVKKAGVNITNIHEITNKSFA